MEVGVAAPPLKNFYWVSSISTSLSERGMSRTANQRGLHSISISLSCHGSQALSCVKIYNRTKRGLPFVGKKTQHMNICIQMQVLESEATRCPVLMLPHTFTLLHLQTPSLCGWPSRYMPICSRLIIKGVWLYACMRVLLLWSFKCRCLLLSFSHTHINTPVGHQIQPSNTFTSCLLFYSQAS